MLFLQHLKYRKKDSSAKGYAKYWWLYGRRALELYEAIAGRDRVLVVSRVSKFFAVAYAPAGWVYNERLTIFASSDDSQFTLLQNSFHEIWMLTYGSTLETRPMYTPSDCFETFPFPIMNDEGETRKDEKEKNSSFILDCSSLEAIGDRYYTHRQNIMLSRQEGLTKTYNRFHDRSETSEDIVKLRELHVEMDYAVAAAYGWKDLELNHDFHETKQGLRYTISEAARREVLDRLLQLNHDRYAEEVAQGLHDKKKKKGKSRKKKAKTTSEQANLF